MNHCAGGPATDQFDMLSALVDWVEQGKAPASVTASARGAGTPMPNAEVQANWSAQRTRPAVPLPASRNLYRRRHRTREQLRVQAPDALIPSYRAPDGLPAPPRRRQLPAQCRARRASLPGHARAFAEVDEALQSQVLEEAGRFVGEVVAPINRGGDEIGCRFVDGEVVSPPGFREAYQAFVDGGWPALSAATEDGGQGLPAVLEAVLYEWLAAANHGLTMAPGLLHGAYACLKHHGSEELKQRYL